MLAKIPRRIASSAISRWLHWLMGRSEPSGISQASAISWQNCSAVKRHRAPGGFTSAKRAATSSVASASAGTEANHRARQRRGISAFVPN
jgi:hypothetical protein